jgi:hypothetical protein
MTYIMLLYLFTTSVSRRWTSCLLFLLHKTYQSPYAPQQAPDPPQYATQQPQKLNISARELFHNETFLLPLPFQLPDKMLQRWTTVLGRLTVILDQIAQPLMSDVRYYFLPFPIGPFNHKFGICERIEVGYEICL